ncbi:MAG: homoserine kinase [Flavobacteriales bacterium]|nr:homoserine kinase [Flavobacteriales bacterium]
MNESVKVYVPATIANVASGFDVLGMAIDKPGDIVSVRKTNDSKITIVNSLEGIELPLNPLENTAGVSLMSYLKTIDSDQGFEIDIVEKINPGGGMGSSAASAVASVFAANELMGNPLTAEELLPSALEGEQIASKAIHNDNVGPALLGGIVLTTSYQPLRVIKITPPEDLHCVVVYPHMKLNTADSRRVLPANYSMHDSTQQAANLAGLIAGLINSDYDLISRCLVDVLAEPYRRSLIPQFDEVKSAALTNGALGCSISGAGPSVFALTNDLDIANKVMSAMRVGFEKGGLQTDGYVSKVNASGPKILD